MISPVTPATSVSLASSAFPRCAMDNQATHDAGFASVLLRNRREAEPLSARYSNWPVVNLDADGAAGPGAGDGSGIVTMLALLEQRATARLDGQAEPEERVTTPEVPVDTMYPEAEVAARIEDAIATAIREREAGFDAERAELLAAGHAAGFEAGAASREPELEASVAQLGSAAVEVLRTQDRLRMAAIREALDLGLLIANTVVGLSVNDERAIEMGIRRVFEVTPERRGTIRCALGSEDHVRAALAAHRLDGQVDVRAAAELGRGVVRFEVPDGIVESDPAEIVAAITAAIRERLHVVPKVAEPSLPEMTAAHEEATDAPAA